MNNTADTLAESILELGQHEITYWADSSLISNNTLFIDYCGNKSVILDNESITHAMNNWAEHIINTSFQESLITQAHYIKLHDWSFVTLYPDVVDGIIQFAAFNEIHFF